MCMHVCMYVRMHACMCMYYVCVCVYMYVSMYACIHVCMYVYTYVYSRYVQCKSIILCPDMVFNRFLISEEMCNLANGKSYNTKQNTGPVIRHQNYETELVELFIGMRSHSASLEQNVSYITLNNSSLL